MKKGYFLFLLLSLSGAMISQTYDYGDHSDDKAFTTDINIWIDTYAQPFKFLSGNFKNSDGDLVAFYQPGLLSIKPIVSFIDPDSRFDLFVELPYSGHIINFYKNMDRKDTITKHKYKSFSPSLNFKIKLGDIRPDFEKNSRDNWIIVLGGGYDINHNFKKKDMKWNHKSFMPLVGQWNLWNGTVNSWRTLLGKKHNKGGDDLITNGGYFAKVGIGKEFNSAGAGFSYRLEYIHNFYEIFNREEMGVSKNETFNYFNIALIMRLPVFSLNQRKFLQF